MTPPRKFAQSPVFRTMIEKKQAIIFTSTNNEDTSIQTHHCGHCKSKQFEKISRLRTIDTRELRKERINGTE
jgi:hypothetical protein